MSLRMLRDLNETRKEVERLQERVSELESLMEALLSDLEPKKGKRQQNAETH